MEMVGEDGAATDGRRKEIHCHLCRKEKHFFSEYSPPHMDVYGHISLYKYRNKHCHITAYEKPLKTEIRNSNILFQKK